MVRAMKLTFLGTGAADWDWTNPAPGTRKSTCSLLGSTCLIDAGPGVLPGLASVQAPLARVSDLLITHSHSDHLHLASIRKIAAAGRRRLRVWGTPQALDKLEPLAAELDRRPVLPGDVFRVAGMRVAALPANHVVSPRSDEQPLHYAFAGRGTRLLYALDGGWFCARARHLLHDFLGRNPLSAVVWDATCGAAYRDWRFAEHNDLRMVDAMREAMRKDGLVSPDAVHVFDHVARTLWPRTPDAQLRLAGRFHGVLAQDGLSIEV